MKTKFIDTTKGKKPKKETVFTHYLCPANGWISTNRKLSNFKEIKYLGKCIGDGDMFACIDEEEYMEIYKGKKGSEFD